MFRTVVLAFSALMTGGEAENQPGLATVPRALHAPNEISHAVMPYIACLFAARGSPLLDGTNDRQIVPEGVAAGSDCSDFRKRAEQDALEQLRAKPTRDGKPPETVVAETLAAIDSHVASLPAPAENSAPTRLPRVTGVPVTMEDEVQPSYERYHGCLSGKVRGTPLNSANVLALFDEALTSCLETRVQSVAEAAEALSGKGWDEAARQRVAETTFAKVDESWKTMGRRLYEALLRQAVQTSPADAATPAVDGPPGS